MKITHAFLEWFGESQCVDSLGNPKLVYHGTDKKFKTFKSGPTWFTTLYREAGDYLIEKNGGSGEIIECYLRVENPAIFEGDGHEDEVANLPYDERYLNSIKKKGYDGIHWIGTQYDSDYWVTFYPSQIKITKRSGASLEKLAASVIEGIK